MSGDRPCTFCGGTGLMINLDPRDKRPRSRRRTIGEPYRCNFCNGTGREIQSPPRGS